MDASSLSSLVERACARVAPTWPLDRFIAVNPFWELTSRPLPEVAAELRALSGARLLAPRAYFRDAWREGRFAEEHLADAIAARGAKVSVAQLKARLDAEEPEVQRRARVTDVADAERDLAREMAWRDFVITSMSQLCAAYFDEDQAALGPDRTGGLYAAWRRFALVDRGPQALMGLSSFHALVRALPERSEDLFGPALEALDVPAGERERYLASLLLDVNGWASWCAYRRWTARLSGGDDATMRDLLAVRLAWELMLLRAGGAATARRWQLALATWSKADADARAATEDDWLFQEALERGWQGAVFAALPEGRGATRPATPEAQAVFCIDVRSEVFRRALEEVSSQRVQTLGFAGFFGLPIDYQPLGAEGARPQLPGLLAPKLRVADVGVLREEAEARAQRLQGLASFAEFKGSPSSAFTFVEALGLASAVALVRDTLGLGGGGDASRAGLPAGVRPRPRLVGTTAGAALEVDAKADLAAGMLRAMSLTRDFAPLVALIGHGSRTRNNPHAAGLDCGACCGQTGEVNARAAAALLNDPAVREALATRGLLVPAATRFVAGLHDTTVDEVVLFDLDELPPERSGEVAKLADLFRRAGDLARAERAPALGLSAGDAVQLRAAVERRARDWAQVRPEWGLANNAAFIVAPRERSRHLDLRGRAFLHDYRWEEDPGFSVLELLMTAPMVVTHWINLQYYASTVDNARYGSGNKVLHNVVGGHLGVFEGNGGDLRIGLPLQSVHDGTRWMHTPQRLSVLVEAPETAVRAVLEKHAKVRELVEHGWLHLFHLDAGGAVTRINGAAQREAA